MHPAKADWLRKPWGQDVRQRKLGVFIVGTQKSGTTALFEMLSGHPQLSCPRRKELHFFDNESINWARPDYDLLHYNFDRRSDDRIRIEATPIYSYWPGSLQRIAAYNREAKLIIILRHPAFRAFSHWCMEVTRGNETLAFDEAVSPAGRQRASLAPSGAHRVHSYVERGFYAAQLNRMHALFPASQILALQTDDLWSDPTQCLARLTDFIGVSALRNVAKRRVSPVMRSFDADLSSRQQAKLTALFADDIHQLSALAGCDLTGWLDPSYREAIAPA